MADIRAEPYSRLLTRLDELVRWRPGREGEYLDPHDHLARIQASANHVVQGRRGSGKSRLLDELKRRQPRSGGATIVMVGMEDYKQLSYPDILIQILQEFLSAFEAQLATQAELFTAEWWGRRYQAVRHPLATFRRRSTTSALLERIHGLYDHLGELYEQSDSRSAEYQQVQASSIERTSRLEGGRSDVITAGRADATAEEVSETARFKQTESKREQVERLLPDFKRLLADAAHHLGGDLILAVDDFYFVRRDDQPAVIDYIHRICKDGPAYLKVATIRHRSLLFRRREVSEGVVPGHEVQLVDLELTLGQLDSVRRFLESVWSNVCREVGIADPGEMFMGAAFHQLILASGGVPRDFFGIAGKALVISRERGEEQVGKLRINEAAREYTASTKFPEVEMDVAPAEGERNLLLLDILRFAREDKKRNCFHIRVDQLEENPDVRWLLDALVDARLLHLITDNTSNARRAGRFAAYLLDVGLYAHPQRRGDRAITEIDFWKRDDNGRLQELGRAPVYPIRPIEEIKAATDGLEDLDLSDAVLPEDPEKAPRLSEQLEILMPPGNEDDMGDGEETSNRLNDRI